MAKFFIYLSGILLWGLSLMIIQFNSNYATNLIENKIQVGEMPMMAYLGFAAGLFNGLMVLGLCAVIVKVVNKFFKKTYLLRKLFLYSSIAFFVVVLLLQGVVLYHNLNITQEKVEQVRKSIQDYKDTHPNQ